MTQQVRIHPQTSARGYSSRDAELFGELGLGHFAVRPGQHIIEGMSIKQPFLAGGLLDFVWHIHINTL